MGCGFPLRLQRVGGFLAGGFNFSLSSTLGFV